VEIDPARAGPSAAQVRRKLREGEPGIEVQQDGDCLVLNPQLLSMAEARLIAGRLAAALRSAR
jgi:hypothetical protein